VSSQENLQRSDTVLEVGLISSITPEKVDTASDELQTRNRLASAVERKRRNYELRKARSSVPVQARSYATRLTLIMIC